MTTAQLQFTVEHRTVLIIFPTNPKFNPINANPNPNPMHKSAECRRQDYTVDTTAPFLLVAGEAQCPETGALDTHSLR